jgi:hypothetical protein
MKRLLLSITTMGFIAGVFTTTAEARASASARVAFRTTRAEPIAFLITMAIGETGPLPGSNIERFSANWRAAPLCGL